MEILRFFSVSVVGVVIDLGIAWAAAQLLGLPLWASAAIGFILAAGGNYVLHEHWTFRREETGLSRRRGVQYFCVSVVTLLVRLAVVVALESMLGDGWPLLILVAGAGVSFFVNFAFSKFLVFAGPDTAKTRS
ncbi:GtrA family protein [uncultured Tistrella sp.]|uniref:GtrA family protein n=1 Tax=Tistrella mobilis TaxID=171437 RepID=UPI000C0A47E0|nr:GtrA family protein [uncultured Tistrella sp.]MAM75984.1 hypothetical protein [Tistrella sp.]|tara:strand:+ start:58 stop:456 length:399 start_codon:yes stop_codon:yes gene_type:complete